MVVLVWVSSRRYRDVIVDEFLVLLEVENWAEILSRRHQDVIGDVYWAWYWVPIGASSSVWIGVLWLVWIGVVSLVWIGVLSKGVIVVETKDVIVGGTWKDLPWSFWGVSLHNSGFFLHRWACWKPPHPSICRDQNVRPLFQTVLSNRHVYRLFL